MANDYTTRESIDSEYSRLLERIVEKAGYYNDVADYVNKELEKIDQESTIEKAAFLWSYEKLQGNIEEIVLNAIIGACVDSGEFNYDLYINQLIKAVQYHFYEIINIEPVEGVADINVNIIFYPLDSIDMWAAAVDAVREDQGWGATRGITEWEGSEDSDDLDLASHMWREKIYQVDREGGKVYKTKKVKDENGEEKTETVDVTENYLGKYRRTIELRLAAIPENTAPFWELIEYGNSVMQGGEGSPYPIIEPTRIRSQIERQINNAFYTVYNELYKKVTDWFGKNILEEFGFTGKTRGMVELEDYLIDEIVRQMGELGRDAVEKTPTGKNIVVINEVNADYQVYKSSAGKLGIRKRGPHGYEAIFGS